MPRNELSRLALILLHMQWLFLFATKAKQISSGLGVRYSIASNKAILKKNLTSCCTNVINIFPTQERDCTWKAFWEVYRSS
mmetsp:Transcript_32832/g.79505  ORF Transcript_32832/g.79505 Transcript_32832/m.79505 type:complete len:81 (+) Transcript_32832:755-997(+)